MQCSLPCPEYQALLSVPVVFVSSDQLVSGFLVASDIILLCHYGRKGMNRRWKLRCFEILGLV